MRRNNKKIGTDTMQNFAELHPNPKTPDLYGFMLRVDLMIVVVAYVPHRWGGH